MSINFTNIPRLRPALDSDISFLMSLYRSTRDKELAAFGWPDAQINFFIQSQFQLQHRHYRQTFVSAQFQIVIVNSQNAGRLYYCWEENTLRLIDIALLPEFRHQGIGSKLIIDLMNEAAERKGNILLHVELHNPARDWYLRLGFVAIATDGVYQQMRWSATASV